MLAGLLFLGVAVHATAEEWTAEECGKLFTTMKGIMRDIIEVSKLDRYANLTSFDIEQSLKRECFDYDAAAYI